MQDLLGKATDLQQGISDHPTDGHLRNIAATVVNLHREVLDSEATLARHRAALTGALSELAGKVQEAQILQGVVPHFTSATEFADQLASQDTDEGAVN
jgi:hypothetical protein